MIPFTPETVVWAYSMGIFPMYVEEAKEILWFRPEMRAIMPLDGFHVSRSLAKTIRKGRFEVRINTAFEEVMRGCADRPEGTWITEDFIKI
jgi:leucyl/phenylalanyl-tRNA--protein transferase